MPTKMRTATMAKGDMFQDDLNTITKIANSDMSYAK